MSAGGDQNDTPVALIVATYDYQDAGLAKLVAPLHDAEAYPRFCRIRRSLASMSLRSLTSPIISLAKQSATSLALSVGTTWPYCISAART